MLCKASFLWDIILFFLFGGSSFSPDPEYNLLLCGKEKTHILQAKQRTCVATYRAGLAGGGAEDWGGLTRGDCCRVGLSRLVAALETGVLVRTGLASADHDTWPLAIGRINCCSSGALGCTPPTGLPMTRIPDCITPTGATCWVDGKLVCKVSLVVQHLCFWMRGDTC